MVFRRPLSLVLTLALTAACSSSPDIPDDARAVDYASTQGAEVAPADDSTAANEENNPVAGPALPRATGPVAVVNGTEIAADVFNTEIERAVAVGMPPMIVANYKDQIIQKLVDRYLLDAAILAENIEVSNEEIDAKLQEVKDTYAQTMQATGQNVTLETLVKQLGVTENELRDSVKQSVAIEKVLVKRGLKDPSDEEVRKIYDDNIDQFTRPEQVRVRHILISVADGADEAAWEEARKRADDVRKEAVKKDVDFATLAKEKSEGPSAPSGGDLGPVPRGKTVPAFEEAAFALQNGEISQPVRSPFGWHIIKSEGKDEAKAVPFEEIADKLAAQVRGQRIKQELDAYLAELREKATVELKAENIN